MQQSIEQKTDKMLDELRLSMDWAPGFFVAFFVAASNEGALSMQQRVSLISNEKNRGFKVVRPEKDFISEILERDDSKTTVWLELADKKLCEPELWERRIKAALSIINKSRPQLEQSLSAPLLIQVPENFSPRVVMYAPEIWGIRRMFFAPPKLAQWGRI
jgi:hypothetical protein